MPCSVLRGALLSLNRYEDLVEDRRHPGAGAAARKRNEVLAYQVVAEVTGWANDEMWPNR